jgi:hypothetical protein
MYVCVYIYICVCVYIYIYIYVCVCVCVCVSCSSYTEDRPVYIIQRTRSMLFVKILGDLCKNHTRQKHRVVKCRVSCRCSDKLTAGLELNNAVWFCSRCSVYFIILNSANWLGIFPFSSSFAFWSVITVVTFWNSDRRISHEMKSGERDGKKFFLCIPQS